ncbi:MAG TPA: radical SAM protein [Myxococcota bacterium]|nr:radical SAM protein [Myxococcota bacterium]
MQYELDELEFDPAVPRWLAEAFEVRRANFDNRISFYAPTIKSYETDELNNCGSCSFRPVSVTGPACALQCDHCKAQVLRSMASATTPDRLWALARGYALEGTRGLLISGGSNLANQVALDRFFPVMQRIRTELGMKILVHVAFVDQSQAQGLAEVGVDSVMLDVIGTDETIEDVYHLPWASTADYERTLRNLVDAGLPISPHVVIGLHYGKILGEIRALEMLARFEEAISSLVLVGLQPLPGTPMADCTPPSPEQMGEIFRAARVMFRRTNVLLGCERPYGDHKLRTDELAVKAGLNGIAYPAQGIIALAHALELRIEVSGMCCSLDFQGQSA